jgi:hypothetical protein
MLQNVTINRAFKEHNDCSVKSIAIAFNENYEYAHDLLKTLGRKRYLPIALPIFERSLYVICALKKKNFHKKDISDKELTIKEFILKHQRGTYIICTQDHACTLKKGLIHDEFDSYDKTEKKKFLQSKVVLYYKIINRRKNLILSLK